MENQFRCLVRSNILQKMEFVLGKINSGVWFVQTFYWKCFSFYRKSIPMFGSVKHFTKNTKCLTNSESALPRQTCNSIKIIIYFNIEIIIHFNIKNNYPNIPIIFILKQPHQSFTIGITPPWCTKMIPTRGIWTVQIHNLGNCIVPIIQKTTYII